MRILILANYANGLYLFRKELVESFVTDGHEVFISVPWDDNCKKLETLCVNLIKTDLDRHGINPFKDQALFRHYLKMIKELHPDVVLAYTIKPNIYGALAARIRKIPYIVNITGLGKAIEGGGILSKVLIKLYKISTKKAVRVFFQNEKNKRVMQDKGIAIHNSDLLPGSGVNLTEHPFRDYPSESEGVRFLAVVRIMKDKGIGEYLDMVEEVSARHPEAHFELVGEYEEDERGNYEPRIKALTDKGLLKYYGHIDNVEEVMSSVHVIVHPSYHEGMSNVLLEAAACGRPILCSNINGCKEAVVEGKSGLLFEPESKASLTSAVEDILKLSESQRSQMGASGRKHIEDAFDRNIIIKKYKGILEDMTS